MKDITTDPNCDKLKYEFRHILRYAAEALEHLEANQSVDPEGLRSRLIACLLNRVEAHTKGASLIFNRIQNDLTQTK